MIILLFLLHFLMIVPAGAMEHAQSNKVPQNNVNITDIIFYTLAWSGGHAWDNSLEKDPDKFSRIDFGKGIIMPGSYNSLKHEIVHSGKRPVANQHCSVFIKNRIKDRHDYFDSFFSKVFFDENGNLDHIETEIIFEKQDEIKILEEKFKGDSETVIDDQTDINVENKKDHIIWSCITKGMSHSEFVDKFRKDWDIYI